MHLTLHLSSAQLKSGPTMPAQPVDSNISYHLMREDYSSSYIHALQSLVCVCGEYVDVHARM